ncbi:COQ9 family protein [Primorskyibacter aestuariivivens]|uniref:COQ9 family protein n=1 Tax=Primorskyibacter aestuariivivens TaxID=1888912 RepID=UPI002301492E|nr:COQ9 family protein [Primorskyibacter aestuariivivens]MDA7428579.1 COQ9 family protein [Primorskyibacter aestuariivivens]
MTAADPKQRLLDAALLHVPFDGWSDATFRAAVSDSGVDETVARALCPRGAVDLALAFHQRGDALMVARLKAADLGEMRFRDRIAFAVRTRLEVADDKEVVRRGTTLFALPHHAADGARAIWQTCDVIWTALGDTSTDVNWYTKRATLSGVYSSTLLFWLGDDSLDHQATWDFLDRRIEDVMRFEKVKAQVNNNPVLSKLMAGPNWLLSQVKAPMRTPDLDDLPGMWRSPQNDQSQG